MKQVDICVQEKNLVLHLTHKNQVKMNHRSKYKIHNYKIFRQKQEKVFVTLC